MKKKKRAFHQAFWRKQMKEQFNTHLAMQTNSLCCPLLKKKQGCRLPVHYAFRKKERRGYWKRKNKRILQPGNCGVNSHVQMCSLYTTARKKNH